MNWYKLRKKNGTNPKRRMRRSKNHAVLVFLSALRVSAVNPNFPSWAGLQNLSEPGRVGPISRFGAFIHFYARQNI